MSDPAEVPGEPGEPAGRVAAAAPKTGGRWRRWAKRLGLGLVAITAIAVAAGAWAHEERPAASPSPEADALARRMLAAVEFESWERTRALRFAMFGHRFLWDRDRGYVEVRWGDTRVLLRTGDQSGVAFDGGHRLGGDEARAALDRAWAFFCNDSFWAESRRQGVRRRYVTLDRGSRRRARAARVV